MNIPVIVDVTIGLVFIYLILSLLASEIQELIATLLQWRSKHLKNSIINLLSGDTITDQNIEAAERLTNDLYNHPLFHDMNQEARGLFAIMFRKITWFCSWVLQSLTDGQSILGNQLTSPSYIPGETFATAFIERLGIMKLLEPLVESKLKLFVNSVIEDIASIIPVAETSTQEAYDQLSDDLQNISQQFIDNHFPLITTIDKLSLRLNQFIDELKDEEQQQKLTSWKERVFGKQNELAIVNGGLNPTLQEIAELIDTTSKNYKLFKQELAIFCQNRNQEFYDELLSFLLLLKLIILVIQNPDREDLNSPEQIPSLKQEIEGSPAYRQMWNQINNGDDSSSCPQLIVPLSSIEKEIIYLIERESNSSLENQVENNLKHGRQKQLNAFKFGFSEQTKELFYSKVFRSKELWPLGFMGIVIITTLAAIFVFQEAFVQPGGVMAFLVVIIILLIVFLCLYRRNADFTYRKSKVDLSSPVEVYFSASFADDSEKLNRFIKDFQAKVKALNHTGNKNLILWELNRLGESFRQYYRDLVFKNADVDWPFIPNSMKQSFASLLKRAKTKITETGNEVNQLREEIEIWFDRSMERTSGVYKRNAKGVAIVIGFLLAVVTNANSIYIVNRLAYDKELRQTVVQSAENLINEQQEKSSVTTITQTQREQINQEIENLLDQQLALPIGWSPVVLSQQLNCPANNHPNTWKALFDECIKLKNKPKTYFVPTAIFVMIFTSGNFVSGLMFLAGWLITAMAVSMGAGFWFEMLGKLINVRNTGNRPPSSAKKTSANFEKDI
ncbi:hypothetical protein [Anabaena azotica]|uniref:Uncharacterized protein n=1 Tax=Anabaena azotica FACHB-119 TaxID=947527 RepID=A0ABR8D2I8_9NOST|nr:hypothetical protein [Anabaena azotica]MBD2499958.1 hypothetical protein [Anabaena azotica FACHB-119]